MSDVSGIAPEYITARRVLLDAIAALGVHSSSAILVGAQAVYHHTGVIRGTGITRTTDGDLALDTDLLAPEPEIAGALAQHGFSRGQQPGSWVGLGSVKVDLMVAPHQGNRPVGRRAANVSPHHKSVTRITPGLEPALVDNSLTEIVALDPSDKRVVPLKVAGPAALLVAKLTKVRERENEGKAPRYVAKDAVDIFRLLVACDIATFTAGFVAHRRTSEAEAVSSASVEYLREQLARGRSGHLQTLIRDELDDPAVVLAQMNALIEELLDALK